MHSHSIKDLWDLPQLNIITTEKMNQQIFIHVTPIEQKQVCPVCASHQTIRRGVSYLRTVRHLDAFGCSVYLKLLAIRLSCKACEASFVWHYDFVAPKKRYTKAFEATLPKQAIGATMIHAARVTKTPATTVARIVNAWKQQEAARIQKACQHKALHCQNLVLGIDDFAIRKGHTYNTGLHDLRNGTFLDVIPGRTILELDAYFSEQVLQQMYDWKEAFIEWYDCSPTYAQALKGFQRWLMKGQNISHVAVQTCLKTMQNWQEEICNYHQLRFTNATVEGKNNLIKALQRRHFFTRNPQRYKETILLACNAEQIEYGS